MIRLLGTVLNQVCFCSLKPPASIWFHLTTFFMNKKNERNQSKGTCALENLITELKITLSLWDFLKSHNGLNPIQEIRVCCLHVHLNNGITAKIQS